MIGDEQLPALPTSPPAVQSNPLAQLFGAPAVTSNMTVNTPQEPMGNSYSGQGKPPSQEDAWMAQLQELIKYLTGPLDFNDPFVKSILDNARATTLQSAGNAGIFGPYSQNLAQQAYVKGAANLQQQKMGQGLQALGMGIGASQNQRDFNYQKDQDKYANDLDLWKFEQSNSPGAWIGGGLGGLIGGIAGIFGGDIAGGAKAGFDIGSGIGGTIGGKPPPVWKPSGIS